MIHVRVALINAVILAPEGTGETASGMIRHANLVMLSHPIC